MFISPYRELESQKDTPDHKRWSRQRPGLFLDIPEPNNVLTLNQHLDPNFTKCSFIFIKSSCKTQIKTVV